MCILRTSKKIFFAIQIFLRGLRPFTVNEMNNAKFFPRNNQTEDSIKLQQVRLEIRDSKKLVENFTDKLDYVFYDLSIVKNLLLNQ